ncbi:N-acetylglucosamine-6-phosphate deacetylase [Infirmifilum lucidum]|uniref:N-acetylglucosamine-6-phosphate deacetylase n=1 Tax=Infirmifilum lucidum TaxID=2776706 RepID=A0A7L9FHJ8_9CREN|nr:N-acetylglucosamine-6-phosphate deacetylase [Infirmifilum lucidum]QOJ79239.1 N-acetylglucosamine-6-phosphate deacetylase [Infirmifilum lucidum]
MRVIVRGGRVLTPFLDLGEKDIAIESGVIRDVGSNLTGDKTVDASGLTVAPGFVDTHFHGYGGVDFTLASSGDALRVAQEVTRHGVTGFLASLVAAPHEVLLKASSELAVAIERQEPGSGARILGIHLEGPYLNPQMRGAMDPRFFREPSTAELSEYYRASRGHIKQVTVAPELPGSTEFIRRAVEMGITVGLGHTDATYEDAVRAVLAGASKANHIFNQMRHFHHREPGVAFALLEQPNVFIEMIADLIHLHPATTRLVARVAGPGRTVLITDAVAATGLPDGEYTLGGLKIVVRGGVSRLAETGALAGSTLTMDRAVANIVKLGFSLADAVRMASTTPALSIGLGGKLGVIAPGYLADLVLLDEKLRVVKTIVGGVEVYGE